ncbi:MAG TPA: VWA domain-containing protein [Candidatus Syntrophoarchaeum butanivorans]|uniref:VWA domain-containing protein n=1 Tax=Candidatus Syntropharchaeum butanivorans TaxID=1839936 RepID=A0A1F2P4B3_9EURY|nr:MAG: von Willebrand factor A [Candidatus Syntrophoarchaeum butanivorans]RJS72367.1 MAG: VWA domain-containing protein [Candidatus Syntrophoarchaeum sp. WYZ-LMO15]HEC57184.1 VWA domain-containing protein [Candidatus Syntrophoarchaeum butanivorans]
MFTDFFYILREKGVPVSITEWMTLMEALDKGLADSSLERFYYLARSILVKSESYYDHYDLAFEEYFRKVGDLSQLREELPGSKLVLEIREELLRWLNDPINGINLSEEEIEKLPRMELYELLDLFRRRLAEQTGRHDGGNKWIGTGGTSPFGNAGQNPAGIRVGGVSRGRSAIRMAHQRRYQNLRSDLTLDVRQIKVALKRLRLLARSGPEDELDLEETIDATCKNAGEIELVFTKSRKNIIKLLLLIDVGGSMTPYAQLCSRLFSAANSLSHFKDFRYFYFHNCIYDHLYTDMARRKKFGIREFFRTFDREYRVIIVGDAWMAPSELTNRYGAIDYEDVSETPGIVRLREIREHFDHVVWLNPEKRDIWERKSIAMIREIFPMFELTLDGLDEAVRELVGRR